MNSLKTERLINWKIKLKKLKNKHKKRKKEDKRKIQLKKERKHRLISGTGRAAERKNTLRTGRFFFVTVLLACFMLTLTSCVKSETAMEIGRDRKFTLSATYLYADEIMTYMQEDPFENIRISFRDSGYQVEDFKEEGYTLSLIHI